MVICMAALAIPGEKLSPAAESLSTPATAAAEATSSSSTPSVAPKSEVRPARLPYVSIQGAAILLIGAGLFAGLFSVPLQVYIQAMAPEHLKGRMIGAMNLINWIGIVLSGAFYAISSKILVLTGFSPNAIFGAIATVILIAAVTFPMRDESLESSAPLTTDH
jgi:acyl-[acyl-carrier-protein]-phospholipid O-acyltransferase/long-chain-fatty-acid--[acyl-carrier-protein] ligase